MPKLKYKQIKRDENQEYISTKRMYENKYYGIFLNSFKFPELSEQQQHYLLKRMWRDGTISAFILNESRLPDFMKRDEDVEEKLEIIFTPYAVVNWNIYDFPTKVNLINTRGATFIPQTIQEVNKDVVLGFAHKTHASVRAIVMWYIDRIVDIEQTIEVQLFTHKLPRLISVTPEDKVRMRNLVEKIENGEKVLYVDSEDIAQIKDILSGGEFIIERLYSYKQHLENELLTWLGVDNVGLEKDERLLVDEVNANNQAISNSNSNFLDSLKTFCENVTNILGFKLSVESTSKPLQEGVQEKEKENYEMDD